VSRPIEGRHSNPVEASTIAEGRQPRSLTVKLLLQGIPPTWSDQRNAFGVMHENLKGDRYSDG
jgi:hypothetical protein